MYSVRSIIRGGKSDKNNNPIMVLPLYVCGCFLASLHLQDNKARVLRCHKDNVPKSNRRNSNHSIRILSNALGGGNMKVELKEFQPIVEQCGNCSRAVDEEELGYKRCGVYINPTYWWAGDKYCPLIERESLSAQDIVKMAVKEGIITKEGNLFVYGGRSIANSISGLIGGIKRNREFLTDLKRKLGIHDGAEEHGKVRVGQQKQRKGM